MNAVSTKPVRHRFGKVSTEEVRQDSSDRGWGFWKGAAAPPPVELYDVTLVPRKVQVFDEVTSHPIRGWGWHTRGVDGRPTASRTRRKGKVPLTHALRTGSWSTVRDTATPAPAGGSECTELRGWTTENQNSAGPNQNPTPAVLTFTKGWILTTRGRREKNKNLQNQESEREKLNLIFKGVISSPK